MVFGFFSDIEDESYIFAVFRRRTSVWTKAVFFAVAESCFSSSIETSGRSLSGWSMNKRIVRLFVYFQFIEKNVVFGFFSNIEALDGGPRVDGQKKACCLRAGST